MLSLPFDKRAYTLARRKLPNAVFFYSRFHSTVEISFRAYLVFSWMCIQRFAESPLSFPRRETSAEDVGDLRFARTRSIRVKGSIAVRRKYEYETWKQVPFFLLVFLCPKCLISHVRWSNLESTMARITTREKEKYYWVMESKHVSKYNSRKTATTLYLVAVYLL